MRFSLMRQMVTVTLIAVGLSLAHYVYRAEWVLGTHLNGGLALLLWLGSVAMIGAGVLCPFRRPIVGALIGLAVQALLAVLVHFLSALAISGG